MKREMKLEEAAGALGLSKSTISRALSGKGRVKQETKDRVFRYLESQDAFIKTRENQCNSKNIGVILPAHVIVTETSFFQSCLDGAYEYFQKNGYDTLYVTEKDGDISKVKHLLDRGKVEGFVLTYNPVKDNLIKYLKRKKIPFVLVGSVDDASVIQVDSNHMQSGIELAAILLNQGENNIALVSADSNNMVNHYRCEGFWNTVQKRIGVTNSELFFQNVSSAIELDRVMMKIVDNRAECVVCTDDALCMKVVNKLQEYGFKIPEDIRVASMHDSIYMEMHNPPITSISVNAIQQGVHAGKILLEQIKGNKVPTKTLSNYEIHLRKSTEVKRRKIYE